MGLDIERAGIGWCIAKAGDEQDAANFAYDHMDDILAYLEHTRQIVAERDAVIETASTALGRYAQHTKTCGRFTTISGECSCGRDDAIRPVALAAIDTRRARLDTADVPTTRPRIVVLCGSTRFYEQYREANYRESLDGKIVLSIGFYPRDDQPHWQNNGVTPAQKAQLDQLHMRKIDMADEVLVLNVGGYFGDSTRSEIEYARQHGKPIRWLEDVPAANSGVDA